MKLLFVLFFLWIVSGFSEEKRLRFFNLDLHISVVADVKQIFEELGHEVVSWSLSDHTWVFGKKRDVVEVINERTWEYLNQEMCDAFYERYKEFLETFDGFLVTHTPSFALLYEKSEKPILIVNSTRYENPFTLDREKWEWLNRFLKNERVQVISNNKADREYLKFYTGIESEWIPSLCLYTKARYSGTKQGVVLKGPIGKDFFTCRFLFQQLPSPYRWQQLYDFQGIVHFPYQISTMSIFEEYSANVPLFFPSKQFLLALHQRYPRHVLGQLSFFSILHASVPKIPGDPNYLSDPNVLQFWIDSADYYDEENMPYIQYFDSFEHLESLLQTVDFHEVSQKMKEYNEKRKQMVFAKWKKVLSSFF